MESIDMLIALSLAAFFMLGVYFLILLLCRVVETDRDRGGL